MRRAPRRNRLGLHIPQASAIKYSDIKSLSTLRRANIGGSLSPNLLPPTPPALQPQPIDQTGGTNVKTENNLSTSADHSITQDAVCRIEGFVLLEEIDVTPTYIVRRAVCAESGAAYLCKIIPIDRYQAVLAPYYRTSHIAGVAGPKHILFTSTHAYALFPRPRSDLHAYVRAAGKVPEAEARAIFGQVAEAVKQCHEAGLVLRDIKLRKCVFTDPIRSLVKLTGLEDAHIIPDQSDDLLEDKHGCPAYVSPEILHSVPSLPGKQGGYSGRAADAWSLGVILYTMLVGRYPFQDSEPLALFSRISIGRYVLPDTLSARARCLIRGLLCKNPAERLTVSDILSHPWFTCTTTAAGWGFTGGPLDEVGPAVLSSCASAVDQSVPECPDQAEDAWLYD